MPKVANKRLTRLANETSRRMPMQLTRSTDDRAPSMTPMREAVEIFRPARAMERSATSCPKTVHPSHSTRQPVVNPAQFKPPTYG